MLAQAQDDIPQGSSWRYEPKWDGFRAIVFRDGSNIHLHSRGNKPLERYFPEVCESLQRALPDQCIIDGEIIRIGERGLDFDALQMRLHPAASRVQKLSLELPATFVAFDLLALGADDLREEPFSARRRRLHETLKTTEQVLLTPQTRDPDEAARWFVDFEGAGCDGVIARDEKLPYMHGKRVMVKIKHGRTADCVVGGFREGKTSGSVGALLLGIFNRDGQLQHVGHTSSFTAKEKRELFVRLSPMAVPSSFGEGQTLGGGSRWTGGKEREWTPIDPSLVCEVRFDYLQGERFRHAATFLRWRDDKPPAACTWDQLLPPQPFSLAAITKLPTTA